MLTNVMVTALAVSDLLRENQQVRVKLPPPRLWFNCCF